MERYRRMVAAVEPAALNLWATLDGFTTFVAEPFNDVNKQV